MCLEHLNVPSDCLSPVTTSWGSAEIGVEHGVVTGPGWHGSDLQEIVEGSAQTGCHLLATHILKTPGYHHPALPGGPPGPPSSVPSCTITAVITIPSGKYLQGTEPHASPLYPQPLQGCSAEPLSQVQNCYRTPRGK